MKHKGKSHNNKVSNSTVSNIWIYAAVPVVLTFIVYFPTLNHGFVDWDDPQMLLGNIFVRDLSFEGIKNIFTGFVNDNYHPFTVLSYAIEYNFVEYAPKLYHFDNVLLHCINVLLVFLLINKLSGKIWVAVITSALFGIHPMHVESVAWVTERKDVPFTLFYLIGLKYYLDFIDEKSSFTKKYWLVFLFFVLSLLSKAQAVTFPVVLLLFDWFKQRKFDKQVILEKLPFFALSIILGLITLSAAKSAGTMVYVEQYTIFERFLFGCYSLVVYLVKIVAPFLLSAIYPYPKEIEGSYPMLIYASPVLVLGILFLLWKSFKLSLNYVVFGLMFFIINIFLFLQLIPVGHAFIADRFAYVPFIGIYFIIGYKLSSIIEGHSTKAKSLKNIVIPLILAFVIMLCYVNWNRSKVWKDSEALWLDVTAKYPDMALAYNHLGSVYMNSQYDKAMKHFNKCIKLDPKYQYAINNRGIVYYNQRKYGKALLDFHKAIEIDPKFSLAIHNRGAVYKVKGSPDKAMNDYNKAIELNPTYAQAYYSRSTMFTQQKKYNKALADALKSQEFGFNVDAKYLKDLRRQVK
ncbi:MAG: tetratricopeptide repeat protein [Bacteroidia bacterium]|nr:tetratricopeptide repeat protein [Bacteroidia bacterium]